MAVAEPLPVRLRVPLDIPTRLVSMYIRQRENETLVAVIELLSPVNKRRGTGRTEYLEKRRAFLCVRVHLIEIDLLRSHPPMPFDDPLPPADYLVMVAKAGERPHCSVWPISVRQPLPTIPIPLLDPDPPVPLALGQALHTAYERARYDLRVDYPPAARPAAHRSRCRLGRNIAARLMDMPDKRYFALTAPRRASSPIPCSRRSMARDGTHTRASITSTEAA